MSSTNLDLPVLISADQIRRREFVTIRRGYDPDQVRAYLEQVAEQMELLRSSLQDARSQTQTQAPVRVHVAPKTDPDPYEQLGARVASVIREADEAAGRIRRDAHHEADELTREARADADRMRTDTQAKAEEAKAQADTAVRAAREEANRTIATLATRRDTLVDQLATMQERILGVARDLESAMEVKITMPDLPSMPDLVTDAAPSVSSEEEPALGAFSFAGAGAGVGEEADVADDDDPTMLDPAYEELWEGTDSIRIELPDIPSLDLDWGDAPDAHDD